MIFSTWFISLLSIAFSVFTLTELWDKVHQIDQFTEDRNNHRSRIEDLEGQLSELKSESEPELSPVDYLKRISEILDGSNMPKGSGHSLWDRIVCAEIEVSKLIARLDD